MLHVFKFGGASVKDAAAVRNVADIVAHFSPEHRIVIIVSAMGKTTNALEEVVDAYYYQKGNAADLLNQIKEQHLSVASFLVTTSTPYLPSSSKPLLP
jgi:aspartate kinase